MQQDVFGGSHGGVRLCADADPLWWCRVRVAAPVLMLRSMWQGNRLCDLFLKVLNLNGTVKFV